MVACMCANMYFKVFSRGVGAMEIVAMDMKVCLQSTNVQHSCIMLFSLQLRGMYVARQLSFSGVAFSIEDVGLSKDFIHAYDKAVEFVSDPDKRYSIANSILPLLC